jgi:hypothetical protein
MNHLRAQWRRRALAGQSRTLYRGLVVGDYSEDDFESEVKRNPSAFVRQNINTRSLGIHWTWDGDSAYNFATGRDVEGYVQEGDPWGDDDEGGVTVGILIEAEVDAAHVIEEGSEEFADYSFSDSIFDSSHPEHEVVVRDKAPIRITRVEVLAEGKVEWSQVVPMSMVVAAAKVGDESSYTHAGSNTTYTLRYQQSDQGERKPRHIITAHDPNGTKVGELNWYGTTGTIHHIEVEQEHGRRGVATAMWNWGQEMRPRPKHSGDRTEMGEQWSKSVGGPRPKRQR